MTTRDIDPAHTRTPVARIYYLDNLRVALTALVVLHHTAVQYSPIALWYYSEPARGSSGTLLDLFIALNQSYFMGFFFLVSGYFVPGAYDRKGHTKFVRDRLLRLGVPFLAFTVVLRAILIVPAASGSGVPYWECYIGSWDPGPTWFLEVLLVFTLCYAFVRRFTDERAPQEQGEAATGQRLPWWSVALFIVALGATLFVWQLAVPTGTYVPILGLPTPSYLPQYAGLFCVGVLAYRRGWFAALSRRAGVGWGLVGVSTGAVLLPLTLATTGLAQQLVRAGFESLFAVSAMIGLLVLFRGLVNRQGARASALARNAFAVYLLHPLVITGLGLSISWLPAPAVAKFAIVGLLALPLTWGLAGAVRTVPVARRFL